MSRYHVSSSEGQYEKDSGEQVLANKLGIATSDEMDEVELVLLEQLYQSVFEEQFPEGQLSVALLKSWHRRWLGNIYEWAGQERAVNISKGGFMFAPSAQLPKLLNEFDTKYLTQYTPCSGMDEEQLITAIAISKRAARTVLTGMCYSFGNATRQGSSSLTRFIGQSAITSSTWRR